ncbi:MAG: YggT family protein [Gemmatimonadales bacterium]
MTVLTIVRYTVFGVVALSALAALGSWLVRTRRISPFSALGRGLRAATDPIIQPVERRLVRMGGNPVHAGGWLVVVAAVVGIIVVSLGGWLVTTFATVRSAAQGGPRATAALLVDLTYRILVFALLVRVIASWFGAFRYTRWMRPFYALTDWIVEPIRRLMPTMGPFDVSPIVAWLALYILRRILLSLLVM